MRPLIFVGFFMLDLRSIFYSVQLLLLSNFSCLTFITKHFLSYSTVFFIKRVGYKTANELLLSASQSAKSGRWNTETYFVSEDDSLHKKWSFSLRIYSVNVTKSAENCGLGYICRRNHEWKTSFFCGVTSLFFMSHQFANASTIPYTIPHSEPCKIFKMNFFAKNN